MVLVALAVAAIACSGDPGSPAGMDASAPEGDGAAASGALDAALDGGGRTSGASGAGAGGAAGPAHEVAMPTGGMAIDIYGNTWILDVIAAGQLDEAAHDLGRSVTARHTPWTASSPPSNSSTRRANAPYPRPRA